MAFDSGFFTSTSVELNEDDIPVGNKAKNGAFLAQVLYRLFGDGISLKPTSAFYVAPKSGLIATVGAGWGIKGGYPFQLTENLDITMNSSASEQVLYIGVRLDVAGNEYTDDNVVARTTFVAETDQVYAIITIPANAVTLTTAMIQDVRNNATYCGSIDEYRINFAEIYQQYASGLAVLNAGGIPAHAENHLVGGADPIEYTQATFTLDADNWADDEYEIDDTDVPALADITADTIVRVLPASTSTADEREAWRNAMIVHGGQVAATSITLLADGGAPTVDIPILIILGGELV